MWRGASDQGLVSLLHFRKPELVSVLVSLGRQKDAFFPCLRSSDQQSQKREVGGGEEDHTQALPVSARGQTTLAQTYPTPQARGPCRHSDFWQDMMAGWDFFLSQLAGRKPLFRDTYIGTPAFGHKCTTPWIHACIWTHMHCALKAHAAPLAPG